MNRPGQNPSSAAEGPAPVIYVVDDEAVLLEMAAVVLRAMGYSVKTFPNAEAAWAAYEEDASHPCLVITDYAMRDMTGLALIAECRRVAPGQKAVLVSGTQSDRLCRDVPCKPDWFLAKPYQAKDLIRAVTALVGPPR